MIEHIVKIGNKGEFRFAKYDKDLNLIEESGWFDNLILNNGKNFIANSTSSSPSVGVSVGLGNSEPLPEDTLLTQFKSGTSDGIRAAESSTYTSQIVGNTIHRIITIRWRFLQGQATGNIAEFGVAALPSQATIPNATTLLVSKALVKDANGNPTTVTVASDEFLDVEWRYTRIYPLVVTGAVPVSNKGQQTTESYTMIAANTDRTNNNSYGWPTTSALGANLGNGFGVSPNISNSMAFANTTDVGTNLDPTPPGANPSTRPMSDQPSSVVVEPYVQGSYKRTIAFTWSLNKANRDNLNAFQMALGYNGNFLMRLDSAVLNKTNQDSLTIRITLEIGDAS